MIFDEAVRIKACSCNLFGSVLLFMLIKPISLSQFSKILAQTNSEYKFKSLFLLRPHAQLDFCVVTNFTAPAIMRKYDR